MSESSEVRERVTAEILKDLYETWEPHPAQAQILYALLYEGVSNVFAECGRKFGKTEVAVDFLRRVALTTPNAGCYYIAPLQRQAKEILWSTKRIHKMIPQKYIKNINNTEMRITFTNDSFIKLDGSDNSEAARGIQPAALILDEVKDQDPAYYIAANPNRAVFNAPMLVIGTPPEFEGMATELKEQFMGSPNSKYFNFPTWENPHISRKWLWEERQALFKKGEEDVWYREYEAKFVRGGKNAIFPMLSEEKHLFDGARLKKEIAFDAHKMDWYCVADPGSTSIFAVLFCAYNRYSKTWYMLDEIYESDQRETSVLKILPRIEQKIAQLNPLAKWNFIYDEAAAWFYTESTAGAHGAKVYPWAPTNKAAMARDPLTKEPWGLSLIKDLLRFEKVRISRDCPKLWWEMINYTRTRNRGGDVKILKRDDHEIDCFRYAMEYSGFTAKDMPEPPKPGESPRRKVYTLEQDLKNGLFGGQLFGKVK